MLFLAFFWVWINNESKADSIEKMLSSLAVDSLDF